MVALVAMCTGVLSIAMPVTVVASNFHEQYMLKKVRARRLAGVCEPRMEAEAHLANSIEAPPHPESSATAQHLSTCHASVPRHTVCGW